MKKSRFTEQQIAFALRQAQGSASVREVCRKMRINEDTRIIITDGIFEGTGRWTAGTRGHDRPTAECNQTREYAHKKWMKSEKQGNSLGYTLLCSVAYPSFCWPR